MVDFPIREGHRLFRRLEDNAPFKGALLDQQVFLVLWEDLAKHDSTMRPMRYCKFVLNTTMSREVAEVYFREEIEDYFYKRDLFDQKWILTKWFETFDAWVQMYGCGPGAESDKPVKNQADLDEAPREGERDSAPRDTVERSWKQKDSQSSSTFEYDDAASHGSLIHVKHTKEVEGRTEGNSAAHELRVLKAQPKVKEEVSQNEKELMEEKQKVAVMEARLKAKEEQFEQERVFLNEKHDLLHQVTKANYGRRMAEREIEVMKGLAEKDKKIYDTRVRVLEAQYQMDLATVRDKIDTD